jgi:hypothetical protein
MCARSTRAVGVSHATGSCEKVDRVPGTRCSSELQRVMMRARGPTPTTPLDEKTSDARKRGQAGHLPLNTQRREGGIGC